LFGGETANSGIRPNPAEGLDRLIQDFFAVSDE
jgi:hypothetical protein